MSYVIVALVSAVVGFVVGALVYRNNATAANKVVTAAQSTASAVSGAASTVASDVKKA